MDNLINKSMKILVCESLFDLSIYFVVWVLLNGSICFESSSLACILAILDSIFSPRLECIDDLFDR